MYIREKEELEEAQVLCVLCGEGGGKCSMSTLCQLIGETDHCAQVALDLVRTC